MSMENLPPRVAKLIMREIRTLAKSAPDGVTYVPGDEDCLHEIFAEIEGPAETPYFGGKFRLKLVIGSDFPMVAPKGYFLTKIYHPNVSEAGEICVNALKKDWKPDLGIAHVLKVIWCLLLVPFPESSLNDEAGKLFMESYSDYEKKAKIWTKIHALKADVKAGAKKAKISGSVTVTGGGGGSASGLLMSSGDMKENGSGGGGGGGGGLAPKEVNAENTSPTHSTTVRKTAGKKIKKKSKAKKTLKRL